MKILWINFTCLVSDISGILLHWPLNVRGSCELCGPERKIRLDCDTGPDKDVYLIVRDKNVTPALAAGLTRTMQGGSSNQFNVRMTQNTGDIHVSPRLGLDISNTYLIWPFLYSNTYLICYLTISLHICCFSQSTFVELMHLFLSSQLQSLLNSWMDKWTYECRIYSRLVCKLCKFLKWLWKKRRWSLEIKWDIWAHHVSDIIFDFTEKQICGHVFSCFRRIRLTAVWSKNW